MKVFFYKHKENMDFVFAPPFCTKSLARPTATKKAIPGDSDLGWHIKLLYPRPSSCCAVVTRQTLRKVVPDEIDVLEMGMLFITRYALGDYLPRLPKRAIFHHARVYA